MNEFVENVIQTMLRWTQSVYSWFMENIVGGKESGLADWFSANWLTLVIVIVAAGFLIDIIVWLVRYKPHKRIAAFFRQKPIEEIEADAPQLRREKKRKKQQEEEEELFNTDYFMALGDDFDPDDWEDILPKKTAKPAPRRETAPVQVKRKTVARPAAGRAEERTASKRPAQPERRTATQPERRTASPRPSQSPETRSQRPAQSPFARPEDSPPKPARRRDPSATGRTPAVSPPKKRETADNPSAPPLQKRRELRAVNRPAPLPEEKSPASAPPPRREAAPVEAQSSAARPEKAPGEPVTLRADWSGPRDPVLPQDPNDPLFERDTFVDNVQLPELPADIPRVHVKQSAAPPAEKTAPESMGPVAQFQDTLHRGVRVVRRSLRTLTLKARLALSGKKRRDDEDDQE